MLAGLLAFMPVKAHRPGQPAACTQPADQHMTSRAGPGPASSGQLEIS
jgi:hypothetical protein